MEPAQAAHAHRPGILVHSPNVRQPRIVRCCKCRSHKSVHRKGVHDHQAPTFPEICACLHTCMRRMVHTWPSKDLDAHIFYQVWPHIPGNTEQHARMRERCKSHLDTLASMGRNSPQYTNDDPRSWAWRPRTQERWSKSTQPFHRLTSTRGSVCQSNLVCSILQSALRACKRVFERTIMPVYSRVCMQACVCACMPALISAIA